jgi:hypothetical protein
MSKKELIELLTEWFVTLPDIVLRQIDKFASQGITYKEIARACNYIYVYKKQVPLSSIEKFGIGLVPSYVKEANQHFENIRIQQEKQKSQVINAATVEEVFVKPQKREYKKWRYDIDEFK